MNKTDWIQLKQYSNDSDLFCLPIGVFFLYQFTPYLKAFESRTIAQRLSLYFWWELIGKYTYVDVSWGLCEHEISFLSESDAASFFNQYPKTFEIWMKVAHADDIKLKNTKDFVAQLTALETNDQLFKLPSFLLRLLSSRHDLEAAFDLSKLSGYLGLLDWWDAHGQNMYPRVQWVSSSLPLEGLYELSEGNFGLPKFLLDIHKERPDLATAFDLSKLSGYLGLLDWWDTHGQNMYPRVQWVSSSLPLEGLYELNEGNFGLPKFLLAIHQERPDLQVAFKLDLIESAENLVSWWQSYGKNEYSLLKNVRVSKVDKEKPYQCYIQKSRGLNVIGFPQGVLGLGEDARLAAECCFIADVPAALINAPIAGPQKLVNLDPKFHLVTQPKYSASLFCLPPTEMMRLALEGGKYLIDSDEYKIGAWPWELPHWPTAFSKVRGFVDEIWAQSEFVKTCFLRQGDTPVYSMPMAVIIPTPTQNLRVRYSLPSNAFLFYLMFDGNSWLTRKNPLAGVQAFQKAFPSHVSEAGVGLVIKAMNVRAEDPTWQKILEISTRDDRIHIITDRLERQDLINLMSSCDSYVSLHRSEGFGRVMAEAMLLGQPVVATNFSGNVDFCKPDTAFLVNGELVPLKTGDYLFAEGQYWCDPDVAEASNQLRTVFDNSLLRNQIASNSKLFIEQHYSLEAVSRAYKARFDVIFNLNVKCYV